MVVLSSTPAIVLDGPRGGIGAREAVANLDFPGVR
jgi:hypothetical protein